MAPFVLPIQLALPLLQLVLTVLMMSGVSVLVARIRNAGIVDVFWAAGLCFMGEIILLYAPGAPFRKWLVLGVFLLANVRLTIYLTTRFCNEHPTEDPRYGAFRKLWEEEAARRGLQDVTRFVNRQFFWIFQLQAVLMPIVVLPVTLASVDPNTTVHPLVWAGVALAAVAFIGEAVADDQLRRFKANPDHRGRTCQVGLWSVSRHPNYFFQWLLWVAYALMALPSPWGWLGLLSPAAMLYFLVFITGIAATEARALQSRADYAAYQQTTSPFIPWFRRSPKPE
jgi:steroid 5-alpha reductase family enzyme